jgi:hypothetical protein
MDLEGIVAKHSFGTYAAEQERTTWFKIRNPHRWRVGKSYLSGNAIRNLHRAGIAVT